MKTTEEPCTGCTWDGMAKNYILCHLRERKREYLCPCIECLVKTMCMDKVLCKKRDEILMEEVGRHEMDGEPKGPIASIL